jgi:ABC-2 type transport system permease protein
MTDMRLVERRATAALAGREVRRVLSLWTQTILPSALTAVLFLAIFGGALGGRIRQMEGVDYLQFILPGLLVMTVAGQSFANASTSVFQAKNEGYIEDVLTSPLRPWQLAAAYMCGGLVRAFSAALVVAAVAMPFTGFVEHPLPALLALLLTGVLFSALGVVTGVWADTFDQHSFIANIVIVPLALVGGVFYATSALPQPWATLTRLDPIFYLVDATRYGFTGFSEANVVGSLVITALVAAASCIVASAIIASGWRLKP